MIIRTQHLTLSKKERSKINKANRAKGYRVEYDSVLWLRDLGCWVKRLRSRDQKGEMSPIDGYYWDPFRKVFGFFQSKYRYDLLKQEEKLRIIEVCKKYKCEGLFFWRANGIHVEILIEFDKFKPSATYTDTG
jgi:hypothetical protein